MTTGCPDYSTGREEEQVKHGENLVIAKTANRYMVTGVGDGDGQAKVSEAFVFTEVGSSYSSNINTMIAFISDHFHKRDAAEGES